MLSLPKVAGPLLRGFSIAFTKPTFQRALLLFVAFVLTPGRHTVTRALATTRALCRGHFSGYHRVLSRARWSPWPLGRVLAAAVLELVPAGQPVVCPVDDTCAPSTAAGGSTARAATATAAAPRVPTTSGSGATAGWYWR